MDIAVHDYLNFARKKAGFYGRNTLAALLECPPFLPLYCVPLETTKGRVNCGSERCFVSVWVLYFSVVALMLFDKCVFSRFFQSYFLKLVLIVERFTDL